MPTNIDWNQINNILGSKGFQNVEGLAGTFLKSQGENNRADKTQAANNEQTRAQLNQNHQQFAANLAQQLATSQRSQNLQQAVAAMNASKLGENENYATRNRILSAVIPKLGQNRMMPGDAAVQSAMGPQHASPFANLPPEVLSAISEKATGNAIANRSKQLMNIDPRSAAPNLQAMGFSPENSEFGLDDYRQNLLSADQKSNDDLQSTIQKALAQDYEGIMNLPGDSAQAAQKKQGILGKIGGVLKVAAPIAASFIPGVGPLAAMALAGAGSAGGTLMQGGGMGNAIGAGLMGAGSAYGAKKMIPTRSPVNTRALSAGLNFGY
jgi:hypothetical protein